MNYDDHSSTERFEIIIQSWSCCGGSAARGHWVRKSVILKYNARARVYILRVRVPLVIGLSAHARFHLIIARGA